mgnify:CR=1 FL=1
MKLKQYTFTGQRTFWQSYKITIDAASEEDAISKVYDLKYNTNSEWTPNLPLEPDDKIIDIELQASSVKQQA